MNKNQQIFFRDESMLGKACDGNRGRFSSIAGTSPLLPQPQCRLGLPLLRLPADSPRTPCPTCSRYAQYLLKFIKGAHLIKTLAIFTLLILLPSLSFAETPIRIVSLKPNITELLFAIGAGEQIVGVTTWCDRPDEAKKIQKIADYIKPNIEKILALKPDLVIASEENSIKNPIEVLRKSGVNILLLPFNNIGDLLQATERLSKITGHEQKGEKLIHDIKQAISSPLPQDEGDSGHDSAATLLSPSRARNPKVLLIVGRRPFVAANSETFLGEMTTIAGGENIVQSKIPYPHISMETVVAQNPDVIIDLTMGSEGARSIKKTGCGACRCGVNEAWKDYQIGAVKNGRVYSFNMSDFRLGPNIGEQIKILREIFNKNENTDAKKLPGN